MQDALQTFLKNIGEDPERAGLKKTPERWEEAMKFLTSGLTQSPEEIVKGALFPADTQNLVLLKDIEFYSLCEHHLLPFFGKVHVGYYPSKDIIGVSKIPRIIDLYARRLQTQERLGEQILRALEGVLQPRALGVVIEASHLCMMMRGVEKQGATVLTHHFGGEFLTGASAREEFLRAVTRA